MGDLYQLLTEVGVKEDNKAIVKILQDIRDKKLQNDLRLLNYYQEVPVGYPGEIINVEADMVDVLANQTQILVMRHEKTVFLKSRHFQHDVIAKVFRADVKKSLAILTMFAYAQIRAERRESVRVKIGDKIPVSFFTASGELTGWLVDISVGGMSILAEQTNGMENQAKGLLSIVLEKTPLEIPATLLKVLQKEKEHKCIFELEVDSKIEAKISQFLVHRQLEIIRELKETI